MYSVISLLIPPLIFYTFPIVTLAPLIWPTTAVLTLSVLGIFVLIKIGIKSLLDREIRSIIIISAVYSSSMVILISPSVIEFELSNIHGADLLFFLLPFLAIALKQKEINLGFFLFFLKIALSIVGIVSLLLALETETGAERVLWNAHLGISLLAFSWINIDREENNAFYFTLFSSAITICAIFLSGTRGPIIALLASLLIFICLNLIVTINTSRTKIFATALVFFTTVNVFANPIANLRFDNLYKNLTEDSSNIEPLENMQNSIGVRKELYTAAIKAVVKSPIIGHGYNNSMIASSEHVSEEIKTEFLRISHIHNTYLHSLVVGGILFFIITIFVLAFPLYLFCRSFAKSPEKRYPLMGIILMVNYSILGMSDLMLGGMYENIFLVIFLAYLLPRCSIVTHSLMR